MSKENNNKQNNNKNYSGKRSNVTMMNFNYSRKKPTYRETLARKLNSTNTFTKIFCFIAIFLLFIIWFRTGMANLNPNYSAEEINFTNFLNLITNMPGALSIPTIGSLPSNLDWGAFNFLLQFLESFLFPVINFLLFFINSIFSVLNYLLHIAGWVLGIG